MTRLLRDHPAMITFACTFALVAGCGGGGGSVADTPHEEPLGAGKSVVVTADKPNLVSRWHAVATSTINVPSTPAGATPEERVGGPDLATVQIAVYDAVIAIAGTHKPFATVPLARAGMESMDDAAINETAYRVLASCWMPWCRRYGPTGAGVFWIEFRRGFACRACPLARSRQPGSQRP